MLVNKVGMPEAKALVSDALNSHARQFGGQWEENLANTYAQHFTAEELGSLASEGRNARYVRKLGEKQGAVGESMQRTSMPILPAYVTAAMTRAFSRMSSK